MFLQCLQIIGIVIIGVVQKYVHGTKSGEAEAGTAFNRYIYNSCSKFTPKMSVGKLRPVFKVLRQFITGKLDEAV